MPDAWPLLNSLLKELKNGGLGEMKVYSVYSAQAPDVLAAAPREEEYDDEILHSYPDLGAEETLDVFPRKSLELMPQITGSCGDNESCVFERLASSAFRKRWDASVDSSDLKNGAARRVRQGE